MGLVYLVTNLVNDKKYVGKTTRTLEERKEEHLKVARYSADNVIFHRAIRKYNPENFEWKILKEVKDDRLLDSIERYYIHLYRTCIRFDDAHGYNLTTGGEGITGYQHTNETKRKISIAGKGRIMSDETKLLIGMANSGENNGMYGKRGKLNPLFERDISEESKQKISNTLKKQYSSGELINPFKDKTGPNNHFSLKYVITTPYNEEYIVIGMNDFCNKFTKIKINASSMSKCALGEWQSASGFKCRYFNEETDSDIPLVDVEKMNNDKRSYISNDYLRHTKTGNKLIGKRYVITTPSGEEFTVGSISAFTSALTSIELRSDTLCMCAIGRAKKHHGFRCRYYQESKDSKVVMVDINSLNNKKFKKNSKNKYVITFPNGQSYFAKDFYKICDNLGLSRSSMLELARGVRVKTDNYKGYKCRLFDEKKDQDLPIMEFR